MSGKEKRRRSAPFPTADRRSSNTRRCCQSRCRLRSTSPQSHIGGEQAVEIGVPAAEVSSRVCPCRESVQDQACLRILRERLLGGLHDPLTEHCAGPKNASVYAAVKCVVVAPLPAVATPDATPRPVRAHTATARSMIFFKVPPLPFFGKRRGQLALELVSE